MKQYFPLFLLLFASLGNAWVVPYPNRLEINCTNSVGVPIVINGSTGFVLGADTTRQVVWVNCSNETMYMYWSNSTAYAITDNTDVLKPWDVEIGNISDSTPSLVYDSNLTLHMGDLDNVMGLDMSASGNAGFETTGKIWNKSTFDGNDDYFSVYDGDPFADDIFSIMVWVNVTDTNKHEDILDWRSATNGEWLFRVQASDGSDDRIQLSRWQTTEVYCMDANGFKGGYGTWQLIGATYDGTNARLWRNGSLNTTCAMTPPSGNPGTPLRKIGTDSGATWDYSGKMDEYRIWNKNLTSAFINAMFQNVIGTTGFGSLGSSSLAGFTSISETYNTSGLEGTTHTFGLVVNSTQGAVTGNFSFNGTVYSVTPTTSGTVYTFDKSITMPAVAADTTVNFSWGFVINGSSYTTTTRSFTITNLGLINCSDGNASEVLQIYIYDEINRTPIANSSLGISFTFSTLANFGFSLGSQNNFSFCITPQTAVLTDVVVQATYSKTGYTPRLYYISNLTLSNTTQNLNLYLLQTTEGQEIAFRILNQSMNQYVKGATIYINRQYTALPGAPYINVATVLTGYSESAEGSAFIDTSGVLYQLIAVTSDGQTILDYSPTTITQNPTTLVIGGTLFSDWKSVAPFLSGTCSVGGYNDTILTCSALISTGTNLRVCIKGVDTDAFRQTTLCNSCTTSAATASITCNFTNSNRTFAYEFYYDYGGVLIHITSGMINRLISTPLIDTATGGFISWIAVGMIGIAGTMLHPVVGALMSVGAIWALGFMGLPNISSSFIVPLAIIVILMAVLSFKKEDNG